MTALPSQSCLTSFFDTLESIYATHPLPNTGHPTASPLCLIHPAMLGTNLLPPSQPHSPSHFLLQQRLALNYALTSGVLAWSSQVFVYIDDSKKGGPFPLGAALTFTATDKRVTILVKSTFPSCTICHADLVCVDMAMQLGHVYLLTDSACSLRPIQGYIRCPTAFRHRIHHDSVDSIITTLNLTRSYAGIRTHLAKISTTSLSW
jgi:hypothetical protein